MPLICSLKSKLPCESDLSKFRHVDRSQRAKWLGFKVKGCEKKIKKSQPSSHWSSDENHLRLLDQWNVQTYNLRTPVVFWSSSFKPLMLMCRWNCKSTVWLVATSKQDLSRTFRHHDWNHSQGGRMSSLPSIVFKQKLLVKPKLEPNLFSVQGFYRWHPLYSAKPKRSKVSRPSDNCYITSVETVSRKCKGSSFKPLVLQPTCPTKW